MRQGTIKPGPPACPLSARASPGRRSRGGSRGPFQHLSWRGGLKITWDDQGSPFGAGDSKRGRTRTQILYASGKKTKGGVAAATDLLCGRSGCSGYKAVLRCRSWHQTSASKNSRTAPACQLADQLSAERDKETTGGVNSQRSQRPTFVLHRVKFKHSNGQHASTHLPGTALSTYL